MVNTDPTPYTYIDEQEWQGMIQHMEALKNGGEVGLAIEMAMYIIGQAAYECEGQFAYEGVVMQDYLDPCKADTADIDTLFSEFGNTSTTQEQRNEYAGQAIEDGQQIEQMNELNDDPASQKQIDDDLDTIFGGDPDTVTAGSVSLYWTQAWGSQGDGDFGPLQSIENSISDMEQTEDGQSKAVSSSMNYFEQEIEQELGSMKGMQKQYENEEQIAAKATAPS